MAIAKVLPVGVRVFCTKRILMGIQEPTVVERKHWALARLRQDRIFEFCGSATDTSACPYAMQSHSSCLPMQPWKSHLLAFVFAHSIA